MGRNRKGIRSRHTRRRKPRGRRTFKRNRRFTRHRNNRRRRNANVAAASDRVTETFSDVLDNSAGSGNQSFLVVPGTNYNYPDTTLDETAGTGSRWRDWVSDSFLAKHLSQLTSVSTYGFPASSRIRLNKVTQLYTPTVTNLTVASLAADPTGHLSHGLDNVKMWFLPNWSVMRGGDDSFQQASIQQLDVNNGQLFRIPLNSRTNKTVSIHWKNKDPYTRGKFMNTFTLNESNVGVHGTATENWWETATMPHTSQWYSDINGFYAKNGQASTGEFTKSSNATFPQADPKFALKRGAFLIEVPPGTACRFNSPIDTRTLWTVIRRYVAPINL